MQFTGSTEKKLVAQITYGFWLATKQSTIWTQCWVFLWFEYYSWEVVFSQHEFEQVLCFATSLSCKSEGIVMKQILLAPIAWLVLASCKMSTTGANQNTDCIELV